MDFVGLKTTNVFGVSDELGVSVPNVGRRPRDPSEVGAERPSAKRQSSDHSNRIDLYARRSLSNVDGQRLVCAHRTNRPSRTSGQRADLCKQVQSAQSDQWSESWSVRTGPVGPVGPVVKELVCAHRTSRPSRTSGQRADPRAQDQSALSDQWSEG